MDSVYFALTLLTVIWLIVWYLWGERAGGTWWPFDLAREPVDAAPAHAPPASGRSVPLPSWRARRLPAADPPGRSPPPAGRPPPPPGWRDRAAGRRPR